MYFEDITMQIKDKSKNIQIRPVDWKDYASFGYVRLKSPIATVRWVYARARSFRAGAGNSDWGGR